MVSSTTSKTFDDPTPIIGSINLSFIGCYSNFDQLPFLEHLQLQLISDQQRYLAGHYDFNSSYYVIGNYLTKSLQEKVLYFQFVLASYMMNDAVPRFP